MAVVAVVGASGRIGRVVAKAIEHVVPSTSVRRIDPVGGRGVEAVDPFVSPDVLDDCDVVVCCTPPETAERIVALAETVREPVVAPFEDASVVASAERRRLPWSGALCSGFSPGLTGAAAVAVARDSGIRDGTVVRVHAGAITRDRDRPLGWAANWSPRGFLLQYVRSRLADGTFPWRPWSPSVEVLRIGNERFETAPVDGGFGSAVGTLRRLGHHTSYRAVRWPGHFRRMYELGVELRLFENLDLFERVLLHACPPTDEDLVVALVEGDGAKTRILRVEGPVVIGNETVPAVAAVTAIGMAFHVRAFVTGSIRPPGGLEDVTDVPHVDDDPDGVFEAVRRFAFDV